ncbi:MAG: DUF4340 domain-containing protein [Christensenellaceae bacterium]|jgi:hypothetical protein|nr:DUF4340 domain-containing protein [Christensenellaceae bacterium]
MNDECNDKPLFQNSEDLKKTKRRKGPGQGKKILLACCALIVLGGAVWGLTAIGQKVVQNLNSFSNVWLSHREKDEVALVRVETREGLTLNIRREGGSYLVPEIAPEVLSQKSCDAAFVNAAELLTESVAAKDVSDLSPYGLQSPSSRVFIEFTDGENLQIEIGDRAAASPHYYVRKAGENTVYLMKALLVNLYAGGISAFWEVENFHVNTEDALGLLLEREGQPGFELRYEAKPSGPRFSRWHLSAPFMADADALYVEDFLARLGAMKVERYLATAESEGGLAQYGLSAPQITLSLFDAAGAKFTLSIGTSDFSGAYARFGESLDVYRLTTEACAFLNDFALPPLLVEFSNIHAITNLKSLEVTLDGKSTLYTLEGEGEGQRCLRDGAPIDLAAFREAFQEINLIPWAGLAEGDYGVPEAPKLLTLRYAFTNSDETLEVDYIDLSVNNLAVAKNGSCGLFIRKDDAGKMLAAWKALAAE